MKVYTEEETDFDSPTHALLMGWLYAHLSEEQDSFLDKPGAMQISMYAPDRQYPNEVQISITHPKTKEEEIFNLTLTKLHPHVEEKEEAT